MKRYLEKLTPVEEAVSALVRRLPGGLEVLRLPVWEGVGMVLAEPVVLPHDFPPRPRSAYDGYAVRSEDTPGRLRVVGEAPIGRARLDLRVGPGEAVYVTTGAYLPEGADTVVPEEEARIEDGYIIVEKSYPKWKNVDPPGSIARRGTRLLDAGSLLTVPDAVGLLDVGVTEAVFYRRLRAAVIETGDELFKPTTPGETRERVLSGQVVATTGDLVSWFITEYMPWVEVVDQVLLPDNLEALVWYIKRLLDHADAVIVTGGTGPSEIDLFYRLPEALGGELVVRGIYVKGGRPTSAVVAGGKLVLGLSGHPLSGLHGLIRLAYPVLAHMGGLTRPPALPLVRARLKAGVKKGRPRPVKVRLVYEENTLWADPLPGVLQLSSANVGLAMADGIALVEAREYSEGDEVTVLAYRLPWEYMHPIPRPPGL